MYGKNKCQSFWLCVLSLEAVPKSFYTKFSGLTIVNLFYKRIVFNLGFLGFHNANLKKSKVVELLLWVFSAQKGSGSIGSWLTSSDGWFRDALVSIYTKKRYYGRVTGTTMIGGRKTTA